MIECVFQPNIPVTPQFPTFILLMGNGYEHESHRNSDVYYI